MASPRPQPAALTDVSQSELEHSEGAAAICPGCGSRRWEPLLLAPDRFHGRQQEWELLRCPSCSLVRLNHPPSPEEMGQHYGALYNRAISGGGEETSHWTGRRTELLKHKSGGALLDLGCSAGGFLTCMKGPGWKLHGVEMSDSVAKRAEARSGATVFVGDILDAPFGPASFDAITCFHVFEHLYHPKEVLAKVSQWLKPGGVFYVMVPNIDSAGAHIYKSYWYALELPRHLFHFSPRSLKRIAQSVDLEPVSITTHREVFIEASTRYILDATCRKLGVKRKPMAEATVPGIPFRVVRKAFRLTVLPVLNGLASFAGDGESIHAIFRKAPETQER